MNDIDFETRGQLVGGLTCWHRLTKIESDELVALFVQQRMALSKTEAERDALRAANIELYGSLKHLTHNAKKSGADMGLALDFATEALAMKGQP